MKPAYWFYVGQHLFHGLPHENLLDHIETLKDFSLALRSMEQLDTTSSASSSNILFLGMRLVG